MADNPYTMTPGSAVADQLQQILTRKREEARTNLLERLNVANVGSEMQYRAEQAASAKEQRQAHARDYEAQAAQRKAESEERALVSKRFSDLQQRLAVEPDYLSKMDPTVRFMTLRSVFPKGEQVPANLSEQMAPLMTYHEQTDKYTPAVGPDGKPIMGKPGERPMIQTRPPIGPQDHGSFIGPAIGPDGKPVPGKFVVMQNGKMNIVDQPGIAGVGNRVNVNTNNNQNGLPYDQRAADNFIRELGGIKDKQRRTAAAQKFLNGISEPYRSDIVAIANKQSRKPDGTYVNPQYAKLTDDQIISAAHPAPKPDGSQFTPEEVSAYQDNLRRTIALFGQAK